MFSNKKWWNGMNFGFSKYNLTETENFEKSKFYE